MHELLLAQQHAALCSIAGGDGFVFQQVNAPAHHAYDRQATVPHDTVSVSKFI